MLQFRRATRRSQIDLAAECAYQQRRCAQLQIPVSRFHRDVTGIGANRIEQRNTRASIDFNIGVSDKNWVEKFVYSAPYCRPAALRERPITGCRGVLLGINRYYWILVDCVATTGGDDLNSYDYFITDNGAGRCSNSNDTRTGSRCVNNNGGPGEIVVGTTEQHSEHVVREASPFNQLGHA